MSEDEDAWGARDDDEAVPDSHKHAAEEDEGNSDDDSGSSEDSGSVTDRVIAAAPSPKKGKSPSTKKADGGEPPKPRPKTRAQIIGDIVKTFVDSLESKGTNAKIIYKHGQKNEYTLAELVKGIKENTAVRIFHPDFGTLRILKKKGEAGEGDKKAPKTRTLYSFLSGGDIRKGSLKDALVDFVMQQDGVAKNVTNAAAEARTLEILKEMQAKARKLAGTRIEGLGIIKPSKEEEDVDTEQEDEEASTKKRKAENAAPKKQPKSAKTVTESDDEEEEKFPDAPANSKEIFMARAKAQEQSKKNVKFAVGAIGKAREQQKKLKLHQLTKEEYQKAMELLSGFPKVCETFQRLSSLFMECDESE